ncbi:glycoside hydrolase family 88/105 protein [Spirochaeta thermophila]|uniref:Unsaturated glucuronyl hydrolase n=1 Tax=Winmispira thermophila (strain ATCC 49972 / DSM 6192 / RI 19.B1) TaxID=665571 RepID=E0RPS0_WINT6|nr:glycoside hydrolase family 88 protein [Spirochaeta thermophila]ADN01384.1 unsaturated glucuronyl hydrolase [Spirochaeta thermophila DSM 6192]
MSHTPIDPLSVAREAAESLMHRYPDPAELPPAHRWHYHQGVFLFGMLKLWEETGEDRYLEYVKAYVDALVDEQGNLELATTELDAMQAGNLLFPLHERYGEARYKKAMDYILGLLEGFHTTPEGGFWHKEKYPNQQWLDGLYMAGPFSVHYASLFGRPELYDLFVKQALLIERHTRDPQTGLLRHAFDYSKQAPWADPVTGIAPEAWGRALGWFPAALLDILDHLPPSHTGYRVLEEMFRDLMGPIVRVQDRATGLWFQVLDKGHDPSNWLETSCSALFLYSLSKGIRTHRLPVDPYITHARKAFQGIVGKTSRDPEGYLHIHDICIGTGVGDYRHYLERPRSIDDLHGVGAFILGCVEFHRTRESI